MRFSTWKSRRLFVSLAVGCALGTLSGDARAEATLLTGRSPETPTALPTDATSRTTLTAYEPGLGDYNVKQAPNLPVSPARGELPPGRMKKAGGWFKRFDRAVLTLWNDAFPKNKEGRRAFGDTASAWAKFKATLHSPFDLAARSPDGKAFDAAVLRFWQAAKSGDAVPPTNHPAWRQGVREALVALVEPYLDLDAQDIERALFAAAGAIESRYLLDEHGRREINYSRLADDARSAIPEAAELESGVWRQLAAVQPLLGAAGTCDGTASESELSACGKAHVAVAVLFARGLLRAPTGRRGSGAPGKASSDVVRDNPVPERLDIPPEQRVVEVDHREGPRRNFPGNHYLRIETAEPGDGKKYLFLVRPEVSEHEVRISKRLSSGGFGARVHGVRQEHDGEAIVFDFFEGEHLYFGELERHPELSRMVPRLAALRLWMRQERILDSEMQVRFNAQTGDLIVVDAEDLAELPQTPESLHLWMESSPLWKGLPHSVTLNVLRQREIEAIPSASALARLTDLEGLDQLLRTKPEAAIHAFLDAIHSASNSAEANALLHAALH